MNNKLIEQKGKFHIECKVIMLSNNSKTYKSGLYLDSSNKLHHHNVTNGGKMQHLYITSDGEIKDNDFALDTRNNTIIKQHSGQEITLEDLQGGQIRYVFKIIATTDTSLDLPQPPEEFMDDYVDAYNNGKTIRKVLVEVEKATYGKWFKNGGSPVFDELKLDGKRIVILKRAEKSLKEIMEEMPHIREEVIGLLAKCWDRSVAVNVLGVDKQPTSNDRRPYHFPKFIEENL